MKLNLTDWEPIDGDEGDGAEALYNGQIRAMVGTPGDQGVVQWEVMAFGTIYGQGYAGSVEEAKKNCTTLIHSFLTN